MAEDIIRVLRVIEYEGPREEVENTLRRSLHGERRIGRLVIRGATIGVVPEILQKGGEAAEKDATIKEGYARWGPPYQPVD